MIKKYLEFISKIKKYEKIICVRHINPDGDAYGSSMGIVQFIKDNFKNKKCYVDGEGVKYLDFLGKHDILTKKDYENALVIVSDTSVEERIDSDFWKYGKEIIKIDHHIHTGIKEENFANFSIIEENVISTCEIIAKIILASKLKLTKQCATFLFTGLVTDSGRFRFKGVSKDTFYVASKLLETGISPNEIYGNLYQKNFSNLKLMEYVISKIKISKNGVGYVFVTKEDFAKNLNLKPEDIKAHLNIMNDIKEIKIWTMMMENAEKNIINVNIRSSRYIINEVASKYDGGGHKLAAGCRIANWKLANDLIKDLEKVIKDKKIIK